MQADWDVGEDGNDDDDDDDDANDDVDDDDYYYDIALWICRNRVRESDRTWERHRGYFVGRLR